MKKIKILYTIPNFDTAGSGKALLNIALGLNKELFEPHILCLHSKGEFFKTIQNSGIPVHVFDYIPKERPIFKMLINCFSVSKKLKKINPDIIHSFHYGSNYTEAISAKMANIKWVFTKKNMSWGGSSSNSWKLRSFLANKIAVQNTDMIQQFYPKSKKISLIPRGVNVQNFSYSISNNQIRNEMKTSLDKRIIICVANFVPVKGIELLINAFEKLQDKNPEWVVWLVGDNNNEYGQMVTQLVKQKELQNSIFFSGKKMNVVDYLNQAEIFVLPTLEKGEGTPVAILEAMSNGKVVIGSSVPGIKDQLKTFPDHLFEAGNVIDLEKKLALFMNNSKDENNKIGLAFKNLALAEFTIEKEIENHEKLYHSLLKNGK
ncbi:MAG: glycosyltransferase [Flavobacterium sp.]|uniref:glycosyltransferase n=1 Tax=Flavobacterium sp. TaxID=239 RepID=UPI003264AAD2